MATTGPDTLAKQLAAQVVEGFVRAGLTQDDILSGPIEFTNLPWQVPPLVVDAPLFGAPFSSYIDRAVYVNTDELAMLWSDGLANMKNKPDKVLTFEGYRRTSAAIPSLKARERSLYLSVPEGFPGQITDLAAVLFSLECAHIMRTNSKLLKFVDDEDNYYASLPTGIDVGIKDGLPAMYGDIWDLPATGMVQEMLRTPRGSIFEGCDYNIISKVRSVAYTYYGAIPDYEGVEWAIQALRVIDGQKELLDAIQGVKKVKHYRHVRSSALEQAVEVVNQLSLTDRQRIVTLKHLLVPEVLRPGQFTKLIYPFNKVPPPVLAERVLDRIRGAVAELQQQEEAMYKRTTPQRSV